MKSKRKSNFELLRIISMFLIVVSHVTWEGNFSFSDKSRIFGNASIQSLWMFGQIGVISFTLISAYFLSKKKNINKKSILKITNITWFWSWITLVVFCLFFSKYVNLSSIIKSIFPIFFGTYWYITAYLVLYIISPYLNIVIEKLEKREFQFFLLIILVSLSVIPTISRVSALNSPSNGATIFSLIIVYFIGGYIRKYSDDFSLKNVKLYLWVLIFCIIAIFILQIGLNIAYKAGIFDITIRDKYGVFMRTNSPLEIGAGTALFLIFKNIKLNYSKIINYVANSMLSVYIIHTNPLIMKIIWGKIFEVRMFENSAYIVLIEVLIAIIVFSMCVVIDITRENVMKILIQLKRSIIK